MLLAPFNVGGKESFPGSRNLAFLPHQRSAERPGAKEVRWSALQSAFRWLRHLIRPPGGLTWTESEEKDAVTICLPVSK